MSDYVDGALYWLRVRADWAVSGEEWTVGRYGSTAYDGGPGWSELLGRENGVPLAWADLTEIGPLIGKVPRRVETAAPDPERSDLMRRLTVDWATSADSIRIVAERHGVRYGAATKHLEKHWRHAPEYRSEREAGTGKFRTWYVCARCGADLGTEPAENREPCAAVADPGTVRTVGDRAWHGPQRRPLVEAAQERSRAVLAARRAGESLASIGRRLGIGPTRVGQMAKRAEREELRPHGTAPESSRS